MTQTIFKKLLLAHKEAKLDIILNIIKLFNLSITREYDYNADWVDIISIKPRKDDEETEESDFIGYEVRIKLGLSTANAIYKFNLYLNDYLEPFQNCIILQKKSEYNRSEYEITLELEI